VIDVNSVKLEQALGYLETINGSDGEAILASGQAAQLITALRG